MSRASLPQRAVWPKLLPEFSSWSGWVGVLSFIVSVILIGIPSLSWWAKVCIILIVLVIQIIFVVIWRKVSIILQRVKQYDFLYNSLELTTSDLQQLQENLKTFIQNLSYVGLRVFEVTGIQWSNPSPLLVISCNQNLLPGSKLVIIKVANLEAMGQFVVAQATNGGYLMREDQIYNPVWWGFLHNQVAQYPHPKIDGTVAILLH